ncbi:MAG: FMN-binding protein [Acidobacteria bacterium]|nr:FMN-binding protein [Acidobacteriota bacterium]
MLAEIEHRAGTRPASRLLTYFAVSRGAEPLGTVYVDTHLVRTLPETVLVVVSPSGEVARVEIAAFREPPEYRPSDRWLGQFDRHRLTRELRANASIRTLAGATLSTRAVVDAVRRALALHEVLAAAGQEP